MKNSNNKELLTTLEICNKKLTELNNLNKCFILANLEVQIGKTQDEGAKTLSKNLLKNYELYSSVIHILEKMESTGTITQMEIDNYYNLRDSYLDNIYVCVKFYFGNKGDYFLDNESFILLDCFKHPDIQKTSGIDNNNLLEIEKQKMVCNLIFMEYFGSLASVISLEERQR